MKEKSVKMKKILILIGVLFLLAGCTDSEAAFAEGQVRIVPVNTAAVGYDSIRSELSFAGRVRAEDNIAVIAKLPGGMVDEVFFDVGDFVNEGDILFTLDAVDIQNNIDSLAAQLVAAEAMVSAAQTGVLHADGAMMQQQILAAATGLAQAEANIEQVVLGLSLAEDSFNFSRQTYEDTKILYEAGVAARVQLEQAELGLSNAEFALEQARAGHSMAQLSLEQARQAYRLVSNEIPAENVQRARDGLAQATAQRDSLKVNLDAVTERLNDASVRAPISGVIGSRNVEPNTMLMQQMPPFTIVSAETVSVGVEVTEVIINQINAGDEVAVYIAAAGNAPFFGTVATVSPAANEMTSTFSVEISVNNADGLIRPGMFAEAFFVREEAKNVIVVPRASVIMADGRHIVYLAQGEHAISREVTTGIESGAYIQIINGLSAGEPLIVTGQNFLTDGVHILVVETERAQ
jgi:RND family efflux transporter MFP subunit